MPTKLNLKRRSRGSTARGQTSTSLDADHHDTTKYIHSETASASSYNLHRRPSFVDVCKNLLREWKAEALGRPPPLPGKSKSGKHKNKRRRRQGDGMLRDGGESVVRHRSSAISFVVVVPATDDDKNTNIQTDTDTAIVTAIAASAPAAYGHYLGGVTGRDHHHLHHASSAASISSGHHPAFGIPTDLASLAPSRSSSTAYRNNRSSITSRGSLRSPHSLRSFRRRPSMCPSTSAPDDDSAYAPSHDPLGGLAVSVTTTTTTTTTTSISAQAAMDDHGAATLEDQLRELAMLRRTSMTSTTRSLQMATSAIVTLDGLTPEEDEIVPPPPLSTPVLPPPSPLASSPPTSPVFSHPLQDVDIESRQHSHDGTSVLEQPHEQQEQQHHPARDSLLPPHHHQEHEQQPPTNYADAETGSVVSIPVLFPQMNPLPSMFYPSSQHNHPTANLQSTLNYTNGLRWNDLESRRSSRRGSNRPSDDLDDDHRMIIDSYGNPHHAIPLPPSSSASKGRPVIKALHKIRRSLSTLGIMFRNNTTHLRPHDKDSGGNTTSYRNGSSSTAPNQLRSARARSKLYESRSSMVIKDVSPETAAEALAPGSSYAQVLASLIASDKERAGGANATTTVRVSTSSRISMSTIYVSSEPDDDDDDDDEEEEDDVDNDASEQGSAGVSVCTALQVDTTTTVELELRRSFSEPRIRSKYQSDLANSADSINSGPIPIPVPSSSNKGRAITASPQQYPHHHHYLPPWKSNRLTTSLKKFPVATSTGASITNSAAGAIPAPRTSSSSMSLKDRLRGRPACSCGMCGACMRRATSGQRKIHAFTMPANNNNNNNNNNSNNDNSHGTWKVLWRRLNGFVSVEQQQSTFQQVV
ncbi:hypothetical protein DFJ77DRAFT_460015, partial [Powellomyces hirtus]